VSADGKRLLLLSSSLTDAFEVDVATDKVLARFSSASADARDVAYAGTKIVAVRRVWTGGLWISDHPFAP
jgi:hypothetical protein